MSNFSSGFRSPYMRVPVPTADDRLGPGNTAPNSTPTQYPAVGGSGMGGSMTPRPLPLAAAQQPFGGIATVRPPISSANAQGGINTPEGPAFAGPNSPFMPGGLERHPATRQGGIMTQSHPDFIGRRMSDQSGGVRPGWQPPMSAVAAARLAQNQPPGISGVRPPTPPQR